MFENDSKNLAMVSDHFLFYSVTEDIQVFLSETPRVLFRLKQSFPVFSYIKILYKEYGYDPSFLTLSKQMVNGYPEVTVTPNWNPMFFLNVTSQIGKSFHLCKIASLASKVRISQYCTSAIDRFTATQAVYFYFEESCKSMKYAVKQAFAEFGISKRRMINFEEYISISPEGVRENVLIARFSVRRDSIFHKRVLEISEKMEELVLE